MEASKRAVIYTRVSRDDSGRSTTIETQRSKCEGMVSLYDWHLIASEEDTLSAYDESKTRPGWERVLAMAENGEVDVIVAYNMDRMTRSMRELERLILATEKHEVGVKTFEGNIDLTNEMGRMVARILTAVARAEVERKGARQKRANAHRRSEGERWSSGWRPFGYLTDGTLVPDEADLIRSAADDVLAGTPIREIARRWREAGVSTPRSKKGADGWTHNGVRSILLNPRNAGLNTYKGEVVGKGNWAPIFSEETHIRLKSRLTDPSRLSNRGRLAANLLSGIATCATCEEPVAGGTVGVRKMVEGQHVEVGRKAVYKCPNDHLSTDREEVDNLVVSAFQMTIALDAQSHQLMPVHRQGEDIAALEDEVKRINDEMYEVALSRAEGRITTAMMETVTAAFQTQLEEVERAIAAQVDAEEDVRVLISENVQKFGGMSTEERRQILARSARIRLFPKGRGKKNVPVKHQVEMNLVTFWKDGSERVIPALRERPEDLRPVNSNPTVRLRARGDKAGRL